MYYLNKPILVRLLISALFLLPIAKAIGDDLPQQVIQLQSKLMEADQKIEILASTQKESAIKISNLQAGLNKTNQEISELKSKHKQLVETNTRAQRMANGHGRGGQK
jgi:septal ring factor EnvC (AmiA/AmiB activator)